MTPQSPKIIYTKTDEAPALATASFLPIIKAFTGAAGVAVETRDISLAGRIIAVFPERMTDRQRKSDDLAELGRLAKTPEANIIKLPNISASIPQMKAAIEELQALGYDLPDYPEEPKNDAEKDIKARYDKVKGSAVNPVLREGNSDRRAPAAVKAYARSHPHPMGEWSAGSSTAVATMSAGDFRHNETSITVTGDDTLRIVLQTSDGETTALKDGIDVANGTVIDGTFMSKAALVDFLGAQIERAKNEGVLFSVHVKATMMKVSDPIIFGHAVRVFFASVFDKHGDVLDELGADPNNGFGNVLSALGQASPDIRASIEADIAAAYENGPAVAMVNSDKGITNLHVPSDVIIDASMPAMIRTSGQMWNGDGDQQDTLAVIPDSSYAGLYHETVEFSKKNGAFDPTTMGTVPNVGLMAQKAEEYGSHDKTFELAQSGEVQVLNSDDEVLLSHQVEQGDIWRMCTVTDAAVQDWVRLAVVRARATGSPTVFWLDENRAHDAQLIVKVENYLEDHDLDGLEILRMSPVEATRYTLARLKDGEDTISVTGNVLRDYLTDLFPILEVGTSAKMLSIVPLMNGGGLFETGAGGSAPKHVQQFVAENHLRWDSLGEFLALAVSLEQLAETTSNPAAQLLGETLDRATGEVLENSKSPSRKVNELDNRGSHFYLAMYWARQMATQTSAPELAERFGPLADALEANEETIVEELNVVQGEPVDLGGYYYPDRVLAEAAMRPSVTLNRLLAEFVASNEGAQ